MFPNMPGYYKMAVLVFQVELRQLNEYETAPCLLQLNQNLTTNCLLISEFLPILTCCDPEIVLF